MRVLTRAIPLLTVSGCLAAGIPPASSPPLCAGTADLRTEHAAVLAADGGPRSIITGRRLIEALDAGCNDVGA